MKIYKQTQISVLLPEPLEERLTWAYNSQKDKYKSFAEYLRHVMIQGLNCDEFHAQKDKVKK